MLQPADLPTCLPHVNTILHTRYINGIIVPKTTGWEVATGNMYSSPVILLKYLKQYYIET